MRRLPLAALALAAAVAFGEERFAFKPLPEFDHAAVVRWDRTERWTFGGHRFHKLDEFYHPMAVELAHPWLISTVDMETSFQQFVIDGFAPSFEPLIGEKWRELKGFLEAHKVGNSVRFVFALTDRRLTFYHAKGTKQETRWSCKVLPDGMARYFTGPRPEHFDEVDDIAPERAYEVSLEIYRARMAWAREVQQHVARRIEAGR